MTKRTALAGLATLVLLAACAKPAAPPAAAPDDAQVAAPAAAATEPAAPGPSMGPADYPAKLIPLIEERPECQQFRAELEAAGKVQSTDPLPVDMNQVNEIVARASEAGCTRKAPQ